MSDPTAPGGLKIPRTTFEFVPASPFSDPAGSRSDFHELELQVVVLVVEIKDMFHFVKRGRLN